MIVDERICIFSTEVDVSFSAYTCEGMKEFTESKIPKNHLRASLSLSSASKSISLHSSPGSKVSV